MARSPSRDRGIIWPCQLLLLFSVRISKCSSFRNGFIPKIAWKPTPFEGVEAKAFLSWWLGMGGISLFLKCRP